MTTPLPHVHGLHIGLNYPGTGNDLRGCVNDAELIASVVRSASVDVGSVRVITDKQGSRAQLARAIPWFLGKLEPRDWGVLSFSGHGTSQPDASGDEEDGRDEAIVTADLELVYDDELFGLLSARAPGSRLLVITDCCHSATNLRSFGRPPPRLRRSIPVSKCKRHPRSAPRRPRTMRDVVHFAGCQDNEYSYDTEFDGKPHGAMTYFLCQAWGALPPWGTCRTLFRLLAGKRPRGFLPTDDYPQTPAMSGPRRCLNWVLPI